MKTIEEGDFWDSTRKPLHIMSLGYVDCVQKRESRRVGGKRWRCKVLRDSFPLEHGYHFAHRRQGPLLTAVSQLPWVLQLGC